MATKMKNTVISYTKSVLPAVLLLVFFAASCDRSVDGLSEPEFTSNPEVFIDGFSPGLEYFPYEEAVADAFSVDGDTYFGNRGASMRFDVPNEGDPAGAFAGAIFRDEFGGRNLSSYNALTFYAKATKASTIAEIGFGQDFLGNEFEVSRSSLRLTTNWRKYTIPIPEASFLNRSRGLFWYSTGPENGDGYTFWIDELQYENIDGLAQPRPSIMGSSDVETTSFIGSSLRVSGLGFTINQPDGQDISVTAAPAYFTFTSSDNSVATVDSEGRVSVVGEGTAEITASISGSNANGSLIVNSLGEFILPDAPTRAPEDVISIFTDVYEDVPVDFYNGFYEPFQTTTSNDFEINGNRFLGYDNFNFVGIEFNQNVPTIDGTDMTHMTLDIFFPNEVPSGSAFRARIVNDLGGAGNSASNTISTPQLVSGEWITLEVDLRNMGDRSNLGQIVFDSDEGPALQGSSLYVANIYLYNDGN